MTADVREQLRAYCTFLDDVEGVEAPTERSLTVVDMTTSEHRDADQPRERRSRTPWFIGIAAALAAVVIAAVLIANGDDDVEVEGDVAGQVDDALSAPDRVEQLIEAMNSGDVAAVDAALSADLDDNGRATLLGQAEASALTGNEFYRVQGCDVTATSPSASEVSCAFRAADPVFVALGVDENDWLFFVSDAGILPASSFENDVSEANAAYADYLRLYHPDDFARDCDASSPELRQFASNTGIALSPDCFVLMDETADDVVAWIEDGRPQP